MKASKYNVYFSEGENFFVFNQLSSSLLQIDKDLYMVLEGNRLENITDRELLDSLYESNFICEEDLKEENLVLCANRAFRYGKEVARVTVLPTINCNFRCWYCYETHTESRMSEQGMQAVARFCKNLILQSKVKDFHLDWFGGEPLMYFDRVVYPLAREIKELCEANEVRFRHSITTNGYLITEDNLERIEEIGLNGFQITLDGAEFYHNKTRFSAEDKETYRTIVHNITALCRRIEPIDMTVRINYTPKNIHTMEKIADSFPEDVRGRIFIEPQQVWQFKENMNTVTDVIKEKLETFIRKGYKTRGVTVPRMQCGCYVENMLQYVVNYDLSVYKCTARDFLSKKISIGTINLEGEFKPSPYYYNYFTSSYMENEQCLACNFLPSCCGMCIQKKIENAIPACPKEAIQRSLVNQLMLLVNKGMESR